MPAEYIPNLAYRFNRRCIHGNSYNWMIFKKCAIKPLTASLWKWVKQSYMG